MASCTRARSTGGYLALAAIVFPAFAIAQNIAGILLYNDLQILYKIEISWHVFWRQVFTTRKPELEIQALNGSDFVNAVMWKIYFLFFMRLTKYMSRGEVLNAGLGDNILAGALRGGRLAYLLRSVWRPSRWDDGQVHLKISQTTPPDWIVDWKQSLFVVIITRGLGTWFPSVWKIKQIWLTTSVVDEDDLCL